MLYIKLSIVIETLLLQTIDIFSFECIQVHFFKDFVYAGCGGE